MGYWKGLEERTYKMADIDFGGLIPNRDFIEGTIHDHAIRATRLLDESVTTKIWDFRNVPVQDFCRVITGYAGTISKESAIINGLLGNKNTTIEQKEDAIKELIQSVFSLNLYVNEAYASYCRNGFVNEQEDRQ